MTSLFGKPVFFPTLLPNIRAIFCNILEGGGSREWYVQRSPLWDQQDCHSLSRDPLLTHPQRLLLSFVFHIIITVLVNLNKIQEAFEHFFVNWYVTPRTLITTSGFDTFFWAFHSEVNFKLLKISLKDFFFSCETTNYLNRNPHHQALPMKLPTDGGARFAARFLRISYGISGHFWSGCSVHI